MTVILPLGRNRNLSDVPDKPEARTNLGLGSTDSPTFAGLTANGTVNFMQSGATENLAINIGTETGTLPWIRFTPNRDLGLAAIQCDNPGGVRIIATQNDGNAQTPFRVSSSTLSIEPNLFQQRNGTTGQVARWFKTFTSATNGEWLEVDAAGNASNFDIAACIGSAGGVARGIRIGGKNAEGAFSPWLSIATTGIITIHQPSLDNSIILTNGSNPSRPGIAYGGLSTGIFGSSTRMGISLSGTAILDVLPTQVSARGVPFAISNSSGNILAILKSTVSSVLEVRNNNDTLPGMLMCGNFIFQPSTSRTLDTNLQLTIERVSDTQCNLVYRGNDGTTRRSSLTFA
jgi:hypothetical protein